MPFLAKKGKRMNNNIDLTCIRRGTVYELSDATALASRVFKKSQIPTTLDKATFDFSQKLLIGVALVIVHSKDNGSINDMLDYLVDPNWDSALQILLYFQHADKSFQQTNAEAWRNEFLKCIKGMTNDVADMLIRRCHTHWKTSLSDTSKAMVGTKSKPYPTIQVFSQEAVANALNQNSYLSHEKRAGSARILEDAQLNDGYRTVPDFKLAREKLQEVKANYENLAKPIARLQSRLILANCMKPEEFHITPILLLGEPGIGKTHFAMQLAKSLGVGMTKISAGGAQGGFQLTGSHTSWTSARPGSLISLLASGESASPVVVVDEADKIIDAQYPVLPVLLDLLERDTAKQFRDEFFEMEFDASKIIFVLTANSIAGVPQSLLSRVEVFNVPNPEPKQRLRIIQGIAEKLRRNTGVQIELDKNSSQKLANRQDIDLRKVTRLVESAFADAIEIGDSVAYLWAHEILDNALSLKKERLMLH
jgi:ATP-dependent Lon protease